MKNIKKVLLMVLVSLVASTGFVAKADAPELVAAVENVKDAGIKVAANGLKELATTIEGSSSGSDKTPLRYCGIALTGWLAYSNLQEAYNEWSRQGGGEKIKVAITKATCWILATSVQIATFDPALQELVGVIYKVLSRPVGTYAGLAAIGLSAYYCWGYLANSNWENVKTCQNNVVAASQLLNNAAGQAQAQAALEAAKASAKNNAQNALVSSGIGLGASILVWYNRAA